MKHSWVSTCTGAARTFLARAFHSVRRYLAWLMHGQSDVPFDAVDLVGEGDFVEIGEEFKGYLIKLSKLEPNQRVLDVGCGIGRIARPLTRYLDESGEYVGFDVVKRGIKWCNRNISSSFENFKFIHVDVYNHSYNAKGTIPAVGFRFPFEDDYFDHVILTSVFTHMVHQEVDAYLGEIARVLKPGGRCLATFFILNAESLAAIDAGSSTLDFRFTLDDLCKVVNKDDPEAAVAYREEIVFDLLERHGLVLGIPIQYGAWSKRSDFLSYQDVVIAEKALSSLKRTR